MQQKSSTADDLANCMVQ